MAQPVPVGRPTRFGPESMRRLAKAVLEGVGMGAPARAVRRWEDAARKKLHRREFAALPPPDYWWVDAVDFADGELQVRCWGLPRGEGGPPIKFTFNGREFDQIDAVPRPDLGRLFWYAPGAGRGGRVCRARVRDRAEVFGTGGVTIRRVDPAAGRSTVEGTGEFYPDPAGVDGRFPLPGADRRRRVHGNEGEGAFRWAGYSCFFQLEEVLRKYVGMGYDDFPRILDWGCGSGRLLRHFGGPGPSRLTGVDVDADNLAWCREHLPLADYRLIPLHPPTPLEAGAFDLLIGVSIFTHLQEAVQFEWLAELRRLAADGAVLLMTVHGDTAFCRAGLPNILPFRQFRAWRRAGLIELDDAALDGHISEAGYYRATFHTREYVLKHWSRYFEIVAVLPGHIGANQDLVVMRKR